MMRPALPSAPSLLLLAVLAPAGALAQPGALPEPFAAPRGVALPPTSAALADEAPALSVNPAGLVHARGAQLWWAHERSVATGGTGDGLFLSQSLGGLGTGFSVEWLRAAGGRPDYRRTSAGLALGGPALSLGAAYRWFGSGDSEAVERLGTLDLGLLWRPARRLSLGGVVQGLNRPRLGDARLDRAYEVAAALRPLPGEHAERLTLSAGYRFGDGDGALDDGRLVYTAGAEVLQGVRLTAGLSHVPAGGAPVAFQAGVGVDLARLGLTYAGGGVRGEGASHTFLVRASSRPYREANLLGGGTVALVDLDDLLTPRSSPALSFLGLSDADPYLRLTRFLAAAERDPELRGVVLKFEGLPDVGWARAEELRQAVVRLRAAGKKVMAVLFSADDAEYMVAAAADEVYALPESSLLVNGLAAAVTTAGGTMEKLGVSWDVARVGDYKTAPEQLTRRDMSPAQRETLNAYLDTQVAHYERAVAEARRMPVERLRAAWAHGLMTAAQAQAAGLVDGVLTPAELEKKVDALVPGAGFAARYQPPAGRTGRWGTRRKVAVVPVLGAIAGGRSREDPLGLAKIAGAETVVRALAAAEADPDVAAIVVRIDSGGGDVMASDLMYRAVLEAKKRKPVVASMGDVAASGGYYAAMGADEVLASPTTLTGSIGVFYLKPALKGLGERLGLHRETVTKAPMATLMSPWEPWTDAERAAVQAWVDASYDNFITQVAASRKLDKAAVDAVARGRVWSGADAHARGLVDGLGGLHEAVAAARRRAGVGEDEVLDVVVVGEPQGLLAPLGGEPGVRALLPEAPAAAVLPAGAAAVVREVGGALEGALTPGLRAELPVHVVLE